jgi:hypothetical protein
MLCPKCNTENIDDAKNCHKCGNSFKNASTEKPTISKMAIISLALGILSLLTLLITSIPAMILGFISINRIKKNPGQLKGITAAYIGITVPIATLILIIVAFFLLWTFDAPPIPNDYTIADLRSAPPECDESYRILISMADPNNSYQDDAPSIGLTKQDTNDLREIRKIFLKNDLITISSELEKNSETILKIWKNAQKGINIINQLNEFPEISDLTEPTFDNDTSYLANLRCIVTLFQIYSCLQTNMDKDEKAIQKLTTLHMFSKKFILNARSVINKLVGYACLNVNIQTANYIANNPKASNDSLVLLAEHFKMPDKEYLSLRNPFLFEYLTFRYQMNHIIPRSKMKFLPIQPLKYNSSMRAYKNHRNKWIAKDNNQQKPEELNVWPPLYPDISVTTDPNGRFPWYYTAYNPVGSMLISILLPSMENVVEIKTRTEIYYDLLQIVLNLRLGRDIDFKACAYSDEYIIDIENKKILSPGPDQKVGTDDDIFLPINPQVLNLTD